jgi:hypothetical protein
MGKSIAAREVGEEEGGMERRESGGSEKGSRWRWSRGGDGDSDDCCFGSPSGRAFWIRSGRFDRFGTCRSKTHHFKRDVVTGSHHTQYAGKRGQEPVTGCRRS